jgi:protein-disulfide isomerase
LKTLITITGAIIAVLGLSACSPPASSLKKTLEENPEILFNVIEKHPKAFFDVVQKAGKEAQKSQQENQFDDELKRIDEELAKPADVKVDTARTHGPDSAPVTIVEYSDYNCGHCSRAHENMKALKEKYGDKIRFVFKHLPILSPSSETAAEYTEAAMLQSKELGYKLHDGIFSAQGDLRQGGEDFLKKTAKKAGLDMAKLQKDRKSATVKERIASDKEEARKYEFNGTPGFMVNGASIHGAYPPDFFIKVIDKILAAKK